MAVIEFVDRDIEAKKVDKKKKIKKSKKKFKEEKKTATIIIISKCLKVIKIDNSSVILRIDKWIKINLSKIPQSLIEKDLRNGKIKVNNKKIKSSYKLNINDKIYLYNIKFYKNYKKKKNLFPK